MAGAALGRGRGASRVLPLTAGPVALAPTTEDREAKDEMRVEAATAAAQAAAEAVLSNGVVAPVVAPVVASIRTSPGPPEAVSLTAAVGGVQQTLTPSEYAINFGAGPSSAVASVSAAPPSAGGAAAATPTPAAVVVGASIRQPPPLPTRSSRMGKGPARPAVPAFKPPARPPRATSSKPGSSTPAATVAGGRSPTANATVVDIQLVLAHLSALSQVASDLKDDFSAMRGSMDTHGLVVAEVRETTATLSNTLDAKISDMTCRATTGGNGSQPAVDTKEECDMEGYEQMESVRAELRNIIIRQLSNATSSESVYSSSDGYRDSIIEAVNKVLSLGEEGSQAWLPGVITTPARRSGGSPVFVRPLIPLQRVRGHYPQALRKRVTAAWCNAVGENARTIAVVRAGEWRTESAYLQTTGGFKGIVAGLNVFFVIIGATGRIKSPTKTGEGVVIEATAGHVALVSVMVCTFLEQAAQMTPENAVGDALHLQWVAETARIEAHLPTDGEVHDGLRLLADK